MTGLRRGSALGVALIAVLVAAGCSGPHGAPRAAAGHYLPSDGWTPAHPAMQALLVAVVKIHRDASGDVCVGTGPMAQLAVLHPSPQRPDRGMLLYWPAGYHLNPEGSAVLDPTGGTALISGQVLTVGGGVGGLEPADRALTQRCGFGARTWFINGPTKSTTAIPTNTPPAGAGLTAGASPAVGTPAGVWQTALELSHTSARSPHPPVEVVWVERTWNAWRRAEGQPPDASGGNTKIYVVELRSRAPLTCASCKGIGVVTGRFAIEASSMDGSAQKNEFVVTNQDIPLNTIGEQHVASIALN